ncbi:unnamed protein product [Calypogeia fissa]
MGRRSPVAGGWKLVAWSGAAAVDKRHEAVIFHREQPVVEALNLPALATPRLPRAVLTTKNSLASVIPLLPGFATGRVTGSYRSGPWPRPFGRDPGPPGGRE